MRNFHVECRDRHTFPLLRIPRGTYPSYVQETMRAAVTSSAVALLALTQVADVAAERERKEFVPSTIEGLFVEQFTPGWEERWSPSKASKLQRGTEEFKYEGLWKVEEPVMFPGLKNDEGLVMKSKAKQHAISSLFNEPITFDGSKPFVVQYEVKLQNGLSCGGAYVKLLSASEGKLDAEEFSDRTPYTIMFGPDRCGSDQKVHFIFRHKNPKTGVFEEKHLKVPPRPKMAKITTLYTLIVNPDNTYEILMNGESQSKGSLLEDFTPPVNPPKEIDDPNDKKPETWVDEKEIPDPNAKKPEDWDETAPAMIRDPDAVKPAGWLEDEPLTIPDPSATKPEEWDDEEDGAWVAPSVPNPKCEDADGCGPWAPPMIPNPAYKGKWSPPMIPNPEYKGEWAPRKVKNPDYFEDLHPSKLAPIGGVGFELWTMDDDVLFDNIYIGNDPKAASKFADETFFQKLPIEQNLEEEQEKKDREYEPPADASGNTPAVERMLNTLKRRTNLLVTRLTTEEDKLNVIKTSFDILGFYAAAVAMVLGVIGLVASALTAPKKPAKKVDAPKRTEDAAASKVATAEASAVDSASKVTKRVPVPPTKDE